MQARRLPVGPAAQDRRTGRCPVLVCCAPSGRFQFFNLLTTGHWPLATDHCLLIQSSRRESNPRFLFVREESLPLDHGTRNKPK